MSLPSPLERGDRGRAIGLSTQRTRLHGGRDKQIAWLRQREYERSSVAITAAQRSLLAEPTVLSPLC